MTMESLPSILFTVGDIDVGDLQDVEDRVLAGEWLENHGAINAVTNEIAIIPASGKTFFAYKAKIVITGHSSPATSATSSSTTNNIVEAAYKVNGTVKDSTNIGFMSSTSETAAAGRATSNAYGNVGDGKFNVLGLSLVGDGIKDVTIENVLDNGSADATMSGWIKDT